MSRCRCAWWTAPVSILALAFLQAGSLDFSDPARLPSPPPGANGYPSRDANLDVRPGFLKPPAGYGEVAFYWWLGDPLTRERLTWQLDQLQGRGVAGLQINYAHSDRGGRSYGLTYPSDPPLFSEGWWDLFRWFLGACRKRGLATSLSDYTLCAPGQGWWTDEIIREHPDLRGAVLDSASRDLQGPTPVSWELPAPPLSIVACQLTDGRVEPASIVLLESQVEGATLRWQVPPGHWRVVAVHAKVVPASIDPMHPASGQQYLAKFFQRFEDRCPGEGGKGLNFFFSDELDLGVSGNLWNAALATEFRKRKGYDLIPELPALFVDLGPRTPKVRLDYRDVMVSLAEENFFRPIFDWHYARGMIYGCDHGGRGREVTEFGDYFRTQRWMTGPGNDSPALSADIVKNKVASSIAHLYQRPRAWLEGYHSSGWGTTPAQLTDATFRNFIAGHNLLTLHGLYYSTHGGFWEWAPPCNHFRNPYWAHMGEFLRCTERLSYLMSQGVHRCGVAVLYPVAPVEAGMDGDKAVAAAFAVGPALFNRGTDFDYLDFESLARARVVDGQLQVSGEHYGVLILPSMRAVRFSTLQQALALFRAGGIVIALETLPEASDRVGRDDPELDAIVKEIFGCTADQARGRSDWPPQRSPAGGWGALVRTPEDTLTFLEFARPSDVVLLAPATPAKPFQVQHRAIGPRDVYLVLGAPKGAECVFGTRGRAELWDLWTGRSRPLAAKPVGAGGTVLRLPLEDFEAQVIVFNHDTNAPTVLESDLDELAEVTAAEGRCRIQGYASSPGPKRAVALLANGPAELRGTAPAIPAAIPLDGAWDFELQPTLENRFGDFRWPPSADLIGAEARQFRFARETTSDPGWQRPDLDDSKWAKTTCSFGPQFWKLGPLPATADTIALEAELAQAPTIDPARPVRLGGQSFAWQTYEFSWRWGVEGDPGHQGWHGLKEKVTDEFICLGARHQESREFSYRAEPAGTRCYLWTTVRAPRDGPAHVLIGGLRPAAAWLNGAAVEIARPSTVVKPGSNPLLLRYDQPGRGYAVLTTAAPQPERDPATPASTPDGSAKLAMRWWQDPDVLRFDCFPATPRAGWFRFVAPPGLRSMRFPVFGTVRAWADGRELTIESRARGPDGSCDIKATVTEFVPTPVAVALRIEAVPGCYAGAALPEPLQLDCASGKLSLGDWADVGVFETYSGGAWYRKTARLAPEQARGKVVLHLGDVAASAEVRVNGQPAGVRVAPPWTVDLSRFVRPGENQIEVLVFNTLANHYVTIPTRYRGSPRSGLIGPVRIETLAPVTLTTAE